MGFPIIINLLVCVFVDVSLVSWSPEEGSGVPDAKCNSSLYATQYGCWEPTLSSLEEQQVFITAEQSLQHLKYIDF